MGRDAGRLDVARPEGWLLIWSEGSRPSFRTLMLSIDPNGQPLGPRAVYLELLSIHVHGGLRVHRQDTIRDPTGEDRKSVV